MIRLAAFAFVASVAAAGCAGSAPRQVAVVAPAALPSGAYGDLVAYGKRIVTDTRAVAGRYVGARMSCEACHLNAGTKPQGGSLIGIYADFPQWNARARRFIALQDRLAECFLYSMNGTPPAYTSREMIALVAYVAWLSRGQAVGTRPPGLGFVAFAPPGTPNPRTGAALYGQRCAACHGARGDGSGGRFPPLWGDGSFNDGAGMHRLATMASFVRGNMPAGSPPNTLSPQQAYDVAAFVLAQPRPHVDRTRRIAFPPLPADAF